MTIFLAGALALSIASAALVWLILPRLTNEERETEDAEFIANYCQRDHSGTNGSE